MRKKIRRLILSVGVLALSTLALSAQGAIAAPMGCNDIEPVCSNTCGICPSGCAREVCDTNNECTEIFEVWCYDFA